MAQMDSDEPAPEHLLHAAARSGAELEALLAMLERRPDTWTRAEYAAVWVRAARHVSGDVMLGAQVLVGLHRVGADLRRLVRLLALLLAANVLLVLIAALFLGPALLF